MLSLKISEANGLLVYRFYKENAVLKVFNIVPITLNTASVDLCVKSRFAHVQIIVLLFKNSYTHKHDGVKNFENRSLVA